MRSVSNAILGAVESGAAKQAAAAAGADPVGADCLDRLEQRAKVAIMRDFPAFVHVDRSKACRVRQLRAFAGSVEGQRVAIVVDAGEGVAELVEGRRAEAGERQPAAGREHAARFRQRPRQVAPLGGQARPVEVDRRRRQRQVLDIAGQPPAGQGDALQHGGGQVEGEHLRRRMARPQQAERVAGAAAGIEDAARR